MPKVNRLKQGKYVRKRKGVSPPFSGLVARMSTTRTRDVSFARAG